MPTFSDGTIEASRVWKRFRRDRARPRMGDRLSLMSRRMRGERNPWRWVLRDVDFRVEPGDSVGIVGTNGAGKSTLLKILTQVMYPSAGRIRIGGQVGALIELRGGMHPDLTGRENALLYGSLLGIGRRKVAERFDEIVDFAQLESSIDRQVKFYSTGMQMRLGFATAAFMDPHVLLVDEVLAVGDAWFQQRCLDRMRDVVDQGTTLVLVSHDLASVEAMCRRGLWLVDGLLQEDGPIREVLAGYRASVEEVSADKLERGGILSVVSVDVARSDGGMVVSHEDVEIRIRLDSPERARGRLYVGVSEGPGTPTFLASTEAILDPGPTEICCDVDRIPLPRGRYYVWVCMESVDDRKLIPWHPAASFDVYGPDLDWAPLGIVRLAPVHVRSQWRQRTGSADAEAQPTIPQS